MALAPYCCEMKMTSRIKQLIEDTFNESGWLAIHGYSNKTEQKMYAEKTLSALSMGGTFSFLEAGTGVGKSFGYLLVIAAFTAEQNKRAIISTNTIALQNDLMRETLDMVSRCLAYYDFPYFSHCQRIGMSHYVNPERVTKATHSFKRSHPRKHREFNDWAQSTAKSGSGLIAEWYETHGDLPFNLDGDDICIKSKKDHHCNTAMLNMVDNAKKANIVFTSHAMLLTAVFSKSLGELEEIDVVLIDEADTMPRIAESHFSKHLNLSKICSILLKHQDCLTPKGNEISDELINLLQKCIIEIKDKKHNLLSENPNAIKTHRANLLQILSSLKKLPDYVKTKAHFGAGEAEFIDLKFKAVATEFSLDLFTNFIGVYETPTSNDVGYKLAYRQPCNILKSYVKEDIACILTSATLSDRTNINSDTTFAHIRNSFGLSANDLIGETCSIEPAHFGAVNYAFIEANNEKPITEDGQINSNWLEIASDQIIRLVEAGKRVLVLTSSYRETELFKAKCGDGFKYHLKGMLDDSFEDALLHKSPCFFTPLGWEGHSFRSNGEQYFDTVVITKIPFSPPDHIKAAAKAFELTRGNPLNTLAIRQAEGIVIKENKEVAAKKLVQGMGRLIRGETDSGTIVILDPRFPKKHDKSQHYKYLTNSIPKRFIHDYKNHRTLLVNGQEMSAEKQSKIMSFL